MKLFILATMICLVAQADTIIYHPSPMATDALWLAAGFSQPDASFTLDWLIETPTVAFDPLRNVYVDPKVWGIDGVLTYGVLPPLGAWPVADFTGDGGRWSSNGPGVSLSFLPNEIIVPISPGTAAHTFDEAIALANSAATDLYGPQSVESVPEPSSAALLLLLSLAALIPSWKNHEN